MDGGWFPLGKGTHCNYRHIQFTFTPKHAVWLGVTVRGVVRSLRTSSLPPFSSSVTVMVGDEGGRGRLLYFVFLLVPFRWLMLLLLLLLLLPHRRLLSVSKAGVMKTFLLIPPSRHPGKEAEEVEVKVLF